MKNRNSGKIGDKKELTEKVITAAINVHRSLGPGFLESVYEEALCIEMEVVGLQYERQKTVPLYYRDKKVGEHRLDLLVNDSIVVELKAIKDLDSVHFSIVRSYMKAVRMNVGLLLNFGAMPLTIKRVGIERNLPSLS